MKTWWGVGAILLWAICVPEAGARKWLDATGKHSIEAEFVELVDDTVRLVKPDGSTVRIAIDRLRKTDQQYARRMAQKASAKTAEPKKQAAAETDAAGPVEPLAEPLALPRNLGWPENDGKSLEKVLAAYPADPVTGYFAFRELSDRKEPAPTAAQRRWLRSAAAVLEQDFKTAADALDLRGCLVAGAVGEKLQKGFLEKQTAAVAGVKSKVLAGTAIPHPVWKTKDAKAKVQPGGYQESVGTSSFSLNPKQGFRLLRVTAEVENVSGQSDHPYIAWALGDLKRLFLTLPFDDAEAKKVSTKPRRLALDEFLFLVTPGGDWIACGHVCEGCSALRGMTLTLHSPDGSGAVVCPGTFIEQGASFKMDVIFSVPEGVEAFRLLVLGAEPVPVKLEK
jgi:hypothetical protein